jgi:large-conductance mechanosensitive channel
VEPQVSEVLEIQRLRTRGETIMKADYINMMINFSILALLIYLAVQVHDLRNPPKHQPAMMGYDNSLELRYNIQEFLNNALKEAINQQETQ